MSEPMISKQKNFFIKDKLAVILSVMIVFSLGGSTGAWVSYESFHYVSRQKQMVRVECPAPFVVSDVWEGRDLGISLSTPNDIFITNAGMFYIVDTASSSVIVTDANKNVEGVLSEFDFNGIKTQLNKPEGVFVTDDGDVYVADTENNRIVHFSPELKALRMIEAADEDVPGERFIFYPRKIAVDSSGRIFAISRGQFSGIMQFTPEGRFVAFVGSNMVVATPLDIIIRNFMTKEQRDRMKQFIPLEYSNLHIDNDDFIYAVTQAKNESQKIKRLNPGGSDILLRDERFTELMKELTLTDVCSDENENYYFLDNSNGYVYVNNPDGYMMYAFGGKSDQTGTFRNFSSIAYFDEKLYITDNVAQNITVYEMTRYSRDIKLADKEYRQGNYEESLGIFDEILKQDANMELAYIYIGRIFYRLGEYERSMQYFRKAGFRGDDIVGGYGAALAQYRNEKLSGYLPVILSVIALAGIGGAIVYIRKTRERRKKI